ncbi:hypothetical protein BJ912DRAFT_1041850 [Pholiota molesta]|nr:hypothetical protein BJ912DRAFT_1041850 [Pholiota molesta]
MANCSFGIFAQLRMNIIRETGYSIKERPLHEAIILARICKKEQWLTDAYVTLITAKEPLDLVNLVQNGIDNDTIAKLFRAREDISSNTKIRSLEERKSEATRIVNQYPELVDIHAKKLLEEQHSESVLSLWQGSQSLLAKDDIVSTYLADPD